MAYRLYLPEAWTKDIARRRQVGVPTEVSFRSKWQIVEEVDLLHAEGAPEAPCR